MIFFFVITASNNNSKFNRSCWTGQDEHIPHTQFNSIKTVKQIRTSRLLAVHKVNTFYIFPNLRTHYDIRQKEQSKQYLQVTWRADRRRSNSWGASMAPVPICSSAARSWMSLCSLVPLIFIRIQALATNVTKRRDLKAVWVQKKEVRANQISMPSAL